MERKDEIKTDLVGDDGSLGRLCRLGEDEEDTHDQTQEEGQERFVCHDVLNSLKERHQDKDEEIAPGYAAPLLDACALEGRGIPLVITIA